MKRSRNTALVHPHTGMAAGPRPVNPPVMRASTIVFDTVAQWREARERRKTQQVLSYGARGTATGFALENALSELEGGWRTKLYPTGLAASAAVLMAFLRPGDHLLVTEAVYQPVRNLCAEWLASMRIECDFYRADGADVESLLRPSTRMIYAEVPGSLFLQMTDLPRLAEIARRRDLVLAVDNTWASGWLFNPLAHGADISILAVTKYISGHSDVMMGAAVCNEKTFGPLLRFSEAFGQTSSPDDAALALRGLRTLGVRLAQHERHALAVAQWLEKRPEVAKVMFPALPSDPGYALWQRDFKGANGLLTVELTAALAGCRDRFIDALQIFGVGASWGGFESLAMPIEAASAPGLGDAVDPGRCVRLHIGLEEPQDLIEDLEQAFAAISLP